MVLKRVLGRAGRTGPARMQNPIYALPAGRRLYAIGDVHGRADLLEELLHRIKNDADECEHSTGIVFLGDYVDRGFFSAQVIDLCLHGLPDGFDAHFLLGNHEQWMLDFLDKPERGAEWLTWGGAETLASYGLTVDMSDLSDDMLRGLGKELADTIPAEHIEFLKALRLTHQEGDILFVHAGIRPGILIEMQKPRDLIWIRNSFLDSDDDHGVRVVHGHTPESTPIVKHNRIGVDTGAFATNILTAVVLEDSEHRFIQTGVV